MVKTEVGEARAYFDRENKKNYLEFQHCKDMCAEVNRNIQSHVQREFHNERKALEALNKSIKDKEATLKMMFEMKESIEYLTELKCNINDLELCTINQK